MNSESCNDDNECSPNYYCYKTSKVCVNFTTCSRYNRVEGTIPARSATQCGSCKTGYVTEVLADGKESPLCQRNLTNEKHYPGLMIDRNILILIMTLIFIFVIIVLFFIWKRHFFKKWCSKDNFFSINCFERKNAANTANINSTTINRTNNNTLTNATAPLEEQTSFINFVEDKYYLQDKNGQNEYIIDMNEYQTATACVPPIWADESQLHCSNANTRIPNGRNIVAQLQNSIPDNQSVIQSIIELPEVNIEQQDNTRNTTLLQTYLSDDDTNPSPDCESNKSSTSKKTKITITQSINQNINMNVNVVNENE